MISTGSGKVAMMNAETYKRIKSCVVEGGITSLALKKKGHEVVSLGEILKQTDTILRYLYSLLVLHWNLPWEPVPCPV